MSCRVELRYATLPGILGLFAAHYWFVLFDEHGCRRFEVWQTKNAGGKSIGHVHCDLKPADAGVGGGPARTAAQWHGEQARRLKAVLEKLEAYPFCQKYRYWPGPNSNTFAAWVLRKARIPHPMGPMALGKRYPVA